MNLISFSAESLSGASYKKLISFLCTISDTVAFTTQTVDRIVDDDDRLYLDNTKKTKKQVSPFVVSCFDTNHFGLTKGGNRNITVVNISNSSAYNFLLKYDNMRYWNYPNDVEDLCFFKNGMCVFASVAHEDMYYYYSKNETDVNFFKEINLEFNVYKIKDSSIPRIK